jgi:uncharacterized repeat protein (TIGR01451 family)
MEPDPSPCIPIRALVSSVTVRTAAALQRVAVIVLSIGVAVFVSGMAGEVAHSAVAARAVPAGHQAATPRTVKRGQTAHFKLVLTNLGSSPALRVKVCDTMPAALTPLPAFRFVIRGHVLCGIIQRLPVAGTVEMDLKGIVSQSANGGVITNDASAKALNTARVRASASVGIITPCSRSLC